MKKDKDNIPLDNSKNEQLEQFRRENTGPGKEQIHHTMPIHKR